MLDDRFECASARVVRGSHIVGTNSIGGFSFGFHVDGGLSCNGCGPRGVELPVRPCVQAIAALGYGWMEAMRKDEATMLHQSKEGQ